MKKIAYIGHSFHQKTLSSQFFIRNLEKNYNVDFYWTLPFKYKLDLYNFNLNQTDYHAVIMYQIIPSTTELEKLKCKNIVLVPMYDNDLTITYAKWRQYYPYKFINFSKILYNKLNFLGVQNNLYTQYAPETIQLQNTNNTTDKKQKLFFWQRSSEVNWELIKRIIHKEQISSVHMHRIESEMGKDTWFEKPSETDIKDYNITFSSWFESKKELLTKINECSVFIVPRLYEGIGITFLEAMSLGKCVLSPDFPTMNEYIQHGHNGLLFDFNHPEKIDLSNAVSIGIQAKQTIQNLRKNWEIKENEILEFIDKDIIKTTSNIQFKKNLSALSVTDTFQKLPFLLTDFQLYDNSDVTNSNSMNFSKYLNGLNNFLNSLVKDHSQLIIYGAGTGAELIISIIPENILCVIDVDPLKQGKKLSGKTIYGIDKLKKSNNKILFSLFGRFDKIAPFLIQKYQLDSKRIISLDL